MTEIEWTEQGEGEKKCLVGTPKKGSTSTTDFPNPPSNDRADYRKMDLSELVDLRNSTNPSRRFRRI